MAKISGQKNMFQALADSTGKLLAKSPPDGLLVDVFSIIGNTIDLDMISLYKNEEKTCFEQVSWSKLTDSTLFDTLETFFTHPFQKSLEKNSNFQSITSSLKPKSPFKERLTRQKVQSILTIPLFCSDTFWGFIEYKDCTSDRKWSSDEEAFLSSFSKSISNKIENCDTEDELHNFGIFSIDSPFPIIHIDTCGNVLLRNKAGKKITYLEIEGKKRKDTVLFKYLARKLNAKTNQLAVQGKFKSDDYLAKASYSNMTGAITIFLKNTSKIDPQLFTESLSSLKLFYSLIDNSAESIQISFENGQLIYVNKIASERLGISSAELNNFNVKDYEKTLENDTLWNEHLSFLKNNKSIVVEGENINQKTGKSFAAETTVQHLIIDEIGYNVASTRDISKRKENENRVHLQKEKYQTIINNMNLGLIETDLKQNIEFFNENFTHISGYSQEELSGKKIYSILKPKGDQSLFNIKGQQLKGIKKKQEVAFVSKNRDKKWGLITVAPKYNELGEIAGEIVVLLDITHQKKIEEEITNTLLKANIETVAKEAFLSNMSHEIRTPLHAIIGIIRELNKEKLTYKQHSLMDSAHSSSKYLLSIINNILDISKIESGELQIDHKDFDLQTMLSETVKILGHQAREKGLQFKSSFDTRLSKIVVGDETRLKQILINIIYNAIKFTQKGSVEIDLLLINKDAYEQELLLKIIDTGHGISKDHITKIFTKFNQEDLSSSRTNGGTGLGLYISKELIELMGGSVTISSIKTLGTEVNIRLKLPLGNEEKINHLADIKGLDLLTGKTILIVEDNQLNRAVCVNALQLYNVQIIEAENGKKAIKALKNKPVDVILMDLQMPILSGGETTRIIREELKMEIPIIAVTANALQSEKTKCLANGFNDYITKPFEEEELIQSIYNQITREKSIQFQPKSSEIIKGEESVQLYDLSILKKMSNDSAFISKMLQIFITTTPELIEDIKYNFKTKNFENLQKVAHSMKPSIDNLAILSIKKEIRELENYENPQKDFDKYTKLVKKVCAVMQEVVREVKSGLLGRS
jgi:PAS domain S-box-containing protein